MTRVRHQRLRALVPVAVALIAVAAGCGSSTTASKRPNTTTTAGKTGPSSTAGVDPNAPEVGAPGDIPDTQIFVPYSTADYTVTVPEGWSQSFAGATTTFTDHFNSIRIETASVPAPPTVAGVRANEVPALQRDVASFQLGKVSTVKRTAGNAVLVTYRAGSAPDPVTAKRVAIDVERYEFWRGGRQATLVLSGARGSDNVDPWKTVTNSFGWPR